jgi:glycosyltransferase involved in cell wall biosynthesis
MRQWKPVLVCSAPGWLTRECERENIPVICEPFPKSRSLLGRLFGNPRFAEGVGAKLQAASVQGVRIVHANDHIEGLLGMILAKGLNARSAIFLRSSGMTQRDYFKYGCDEYDLIAAVGGRFRARVQDWDPSSSVQLIPDGLALDELNIPKQKPKRAPSRILVVGSPADLKGWADLTEALYLLERNSTLPPMVFDFTGERPDEKTNDLKLDRLVHHKCNFMGRVEAFRELVRSYDLVVNPTRMESFGMAALEVVATGVPLLSTRTGVIEQVLESPDVLFPPNRPDILAPALERVLLHWEKIDFGTERGQKNIRARFLIDYTVTRLNEHYKSILSR